MVCPRGAGRPERYFLPRIILIAIIRRGVNLALAGRFCLAAEFGEDFVFLENHVFLVVNLDIVARVFSEQDSIAHFYVERDAIALFVELAGANGDDFAFTWGFSFAESGIMMPPFTDSFSSSRFTSTRSCSGVILTAIFASPPMGTVNCTGREVGLALLAGER